MFYAHFVLAKKGPLSRIWLAAHWDKKLTKAHVFETNIESSVDGIMQPKVKMALRTSGHLLLGVVRIYSRKAKYLLSDCNEAFVKIKMAFRPGMVDLPEENREAAINAITLPEVFHDFDTAMPDLDDVADIHAQLSMNQTRAEEITMREDYGNINLDTVDDGFGEQIGSPEMLRETELGCGPGDGMSLLDGQSVMEDERSAALGYTHSMVGSKAGSVIGGHSLAMSPSQSLVSAHTTRTGLDAPIGDDGFGGTVSGTGQDVLAGGLFEDGSLFDDGPPPSLPASERVPESHYDDGDHFGGPPSPGPSSPGDSRPATPLENPAVMDSAMDSSPLSPTPSHTSVRSAASLAASSIAGPPASPARSIASASGHTPGAEAGDKETTTLIHNEEESFALAPVEASTLAKGLTQRAKRKRKLIVDEIKAISGEEMKAQLSDTNDIVTTLDLAPPTKRLMHWKETGGVEKLFVLPGRVLSSKDISTDYNENLIARSHDTETFDTLLGDSQDQEQLPLENYKDGAGEASPQTPGKKETKSRKRKAEEAGSKRQSEYQKRQEELARQMEESAKEETLRRERESLGAGAAETSGLGLEQAQPPQSPYQDSYGGATPGYQTPGYQTPGYPDTPGYPPAGQTPSCATPQFPGSTPAWNHTPHNHTGEGPLYGPAATPDYSAATPTPGQAPPSLYQSPPEIARPDSAQPQLPGPGQDFTDQWVSQAANATASGAAPLPHPGEDLNDDWDDGPRPDSGMSGGDTRGYSDDEEEEEEEEDGEYMDQETVEQFEDRVLNKRAAKLQFRMRKLYEDTSSLTYNDLAKRKDTKKDNAQKFYSLLVLQKFHALDINQSTIYGDLNITKGPCFEMDTTAVKAN